MLQFDSFKTQFLFLFGHYKWVINKPPHSPAFHALLIEILLLNYCWHACGVQSQGDWEMKKKISTKLHVYVSRPTTRLPDSHATVFFLFFFCCLLFWLNTTRKNNKFHCIDRIQNDLYIQIFSQLLATAAFMPIHGQLSFIVV